MYSLLWLNRVHIMKNQWLMRIRTRTNFIEVLPKGLEYTPWRWSTHNMNWHDADVQYVLISPNVLEPTRLLAITNKHIGSALVTGIMIYGISSLTAPFQCTMQCQTNHIMMTHHMETFQRYWPSQRPETRSFDVCFLSAPEQTIEQTIETPMIWEVIAPIVTSL